VSEKKKEIRNLGRDKTRGTLSWVLQIIKLGGASGQNQNWKKKFRDQSCRENFWSGRRLPESTKAMGGKNVCRKVDNEKNGSKPGASGVF